MGASGVRIAGYLLWLAWVVWCVSAGTLAGIGLIEFNWGGPPYDGGFAGDLMLFGWFLALGQAPFVAGFFLALRMEGRFAGGIGAAVFLAVLWAFFGLVGWTLGSYFEVWLQTPLYSGLRVLAGVLPWLCVAVLEAVVFVIALDRVPPGARLVCGLVWVAAVGTGGFLYEWWNFLDIAAMQNPIKDAIGAYLEGLGVAENLAFQVVPLALSLPLLYGVPTGLALLAIHRLGTRPTP